MSNKEKYTTPNEQRESVHSTCPRERTTSALVLSYSSLEGATEAALPINHVYVRIIFSRI